MIIHLPMAFTGSPSKYIVHNIQRVHINHDQHGADSIIEVHTEFHRNCADFKVGNIGERKHLQNG